MISHAVKARLTSEVGLVGGRVYPVRMPQNPTYPAIVYRRASRVPTAAMVADRPDTMYRIQVDVWAERYDDATVGAQQVVAQVRAALNRWEGTAGGFAVVHGFLDNEFDSEEELMPHLHRVILDFILWAEA